jgi:hypothetical protein
MQVAAGWAQKVDLQDTESSTTVGAEADPEESP